MASLTELEYLGRARNCQPVRSAAGSDARTHEEAKLPQRTDRTARNDVGTRQDVTTGGRTHQILALQSRADL